MHGKPTRNDVAVVAGACALFATSAAIGVASADGATTTLIALGGGVLAITAVQVLVARRLNDILRRDLRITGGHVEALAWLSTTLGVRQPLPPMRGWAASPDFAVVIVRTILRDKPRSVVELGSGVSTVIAAYAAERAGSPCHIWSVEHDRDHLARVAAELRDHGLTERVTLIHAPLVPMHLDGEEFLWYEQSQLDRIETIDLLVVDGPPGRVGAHVRDPAVPVLRPKFSTGAVVIADDANRPEERRAIRRWTEDGRLQVETAIDTEKGTTVLRRRA